MERQVGTPSRPARSAGRFVSCKQELDGRSAGSQTAEELGRLTTTDCVRSQDGAAVRKGYGECEPVAAHLTRVVGRARVHGLTFLHWPAVLTGVFAGGRQHAGRAERNRCPEPPMRTVILDGGNSGGIKRDLDMLAAPGPNEGRRLERAVAHAQ